MRINVGQIKQGYKGAQNYLKTHGHMRSHGHMTLEAHGLKENHGYMMLKAHDHIKREQDTILDEVYDLMRLRGHSLGLTNDECHGEVHSKGDQCSLDHSSEYQGGMGCLSGDQCAIFYDFDSNKAKFFPAREN